MKIRHTGLPGVLLLEPEKHEDARGFFFESYSRRDFEKATGLDIEFVQDNHTFSGKGVLRGLHYQLCPFAQGKLVRVVRGAIFDVAVDLRRSSPAFGKWTAEILSAENGHQIWIPEGFAHGFLALADNTECLYKTTAFYAPDAERTIAWNDPDIGITWPDGLAPVLSGKDRQGQPLRHADVFG